MRIICIFPSNECMPWSQSHAIPAALRRMGHQAISAPALDTNFAPVPPHLHQQLAQTHHLARQCDLALITAAEKLSTQWWANIHSPKALWFIDNTGLQDNDYTPRYRHCLTLTPYCFFPAAQDAATFNRPWLPDCADTTVFQPMPQIPKQHGPSFIGHAYGNRPQWLETLRASGIPIQHPDTPRPLWIPTDPFAHLHACQLAALYNSCSAIIGPPAPTQRYGPRAMEAAACAIPHLMPQFQAASRANLPAFQSPQLTYDPSELNTLKALLSNPALLAKAAAQTHNEVLHKHTLEIRLTQLLHHLSLANPQA